MTGRLIEFCPLTAEEQKELLKRFGSQLSGEEIELLSTAFKTPLELRIAASCLDQLGSMPNRFMLFDAYVRRQSEGSIQYSLLRQLLIEIASAMMPTLQFRLPLHQFWQICERVLRRLNAQPTAIEAVFETGLIEKRHGHCIFRHELFQRYFESLVISKNAETDPELEELLSKPENHALIEFVTGMQVHSSSIRACLRASSSTTLGGSLFKSGAKGELGQAVQRTIFQDMESVLARARCELEEGGISITSDSVSPVNGFYEYEMTYLPERSTYDRYLVDTVATEVSKGNFLDDVLDLIESTESRSLAILKAIFSEKVCDNHVFLSQFYRRMFIVEGDRFPAMQIVHARSSGWAFETDHKVLTKIQDLFKTPQDLTPAQIYLLLHLLPVRSTVPEDNLVAFVRHCWDTGVYHLRLETLEHLQRWNVFCGNEEPLALDVRSELETLLSSFLSSNPFLNSIVIDTLRAFDLLEPIKNKEQAYAEVKTVISAPHDAMQQRIAASLIGNMFEEVYGDSYYCAIDELPEEEWLTFLVMAALGMPLDMLAITGGFILGELLKKSDTRILPAFQRFAETVPEENMFLQDAVSCFVLGQVGCSKYLGHPVRPLKSDDRNRKAWHSYGELLFWLSKSNLSDEEVEDKCRDIWRSFKSELFRQAIDPLMRILQSSSCGFDRERHIPMRRMVTLFRDPLRSVLEAGFVHRQELTSLFRQDITEWERKELTSFIIQMLGQLGSDRSISLLTPLVSDPQHGAQAVEAIRNINSGQTAEVSSLRIRF